MYLSIFFVIILFVGGFILIGFIRGINVPRDFGKISKGMSIYDVQSLYEMDIRHSPYCYKTNKFNKLTFWYMNNDWLAIAEMDYDLDGIIVNVYELKRYDGPFHGFRYLYEKIPYEQLYFSHY